MKWPDCIVIDPKDLGGKPFLQGACQAVEFLHDCLAQGWADQKLSNNYLEITRAEHQAGLADASEILKGAKGYAFPKTGNVPD